MHYKTVHSSRDELIYSLSRLKRTELVEVEKRHSCPTCKKVFKKLTDLASHLDTAGHFPQTRPGEINVFRCPFDNCAYLSTHFFPLKTHLLSHPFFNKPRSGPDAELRIVVHFDVYDAPVSFLHIASFSGGTALERKEEMDAIDSLLESLKGHSDTTDIGKRLKARKDHLIKLGTNPRRSADSNLSF